MRHKLLIFLKLLPLRLKVFYGQTCMRLGFVPQSLRNAFAPNPMLKYPRNLNCFCGSYKKAKHCCLPKQAPVMPAEFAEKLRSFMRQAEIMNNGDATRPRIIQ